jgi:hypothetical protein
LSKREIAASVENAAETHAARPHVNLGLMLAIGLCIEFWLAVGVAVARLAG